MDAKEAIELLKKHIELEGMFGVTDIKKEETSSNAPEKTETIEKTNKNGLSLLKTFEQEIANCEKCSLHKSRTNIVFGEGSDNADLVFVGEAPGEDEDIMGKPFVGEAGQLLTKIIEQGMKLKRSDVYICNILKCRPPEKRMALPEETQICEQYLLKQLKIIKPKVICTLGKFAAQTLLKSEVSISELRGKFYDYHGIPLMPTFHPAYLLHNPSQKKIVWEDIQKIMQKLSGH
jgi:uracil-DNA glycosylase family 4